MVEGAKNVLEVLNSGYEMEYLFVTEKFLVEYENLPEINPNYEVCTEAELVDMGTYRSNEWALAVVKMKKSSLNIADDHIVIALDSINDPGNLGTILRIADWYGIKTIVASEDTADVYNPKVINASMGSFTRLNVHYMDLGIFFQSNKTHSVYGAVLNGEDVHRTDFEPMSILLMGNESHGIHTSLLDFIHHKITIPKIGGAESLNVAVSTAIICDNFLRN